MTPPLKLQIIVGSTREGRQADVVVPWIVDRASEHGAFDVRLLDLRDWPLPMFAESSAAYADPPVWSAPVVGEWNRTIGEGDAYLMITPEYNHSIPGVLKNAIDSVFGSYAFRNKVTGFVGYSGGLVGAARAVEHLAQMAVEAELVPLRNSVLVARVREALDDGEPADPASDHALRILLDDLAWWGGALRQARLRGELPPPGARRVAA